MIFAVDCIKATSSHTQLVSYTSLVSGLKFQTVADALLTPGVSACEGIHGHGSHNDLIRLGLELADKQFRYYVILCHLERTFGKKKMSQFGKVKVKTTWLSLEKLFFFFYNYV